MRMKIKYIRLLLQSASQSQLHAESFSNSVPEGTTLTVYAGTKASRATSAHSVTTKFSNKNCHSGTLSFSSQPSVCIMDIFVQPDLLPAQLSLLSILKAQTAISEHLLASERRTGESQGLSRPLVAQLQPQPQP
jgi:hypothetical protein